MSEAEKKDEPKVSPVDHVKAKFGQALAFVKKFKKKKDGDSEADGEATAHAPEVTEEDPNSKAYKIKAFLRSKAEIFKGKFSVIIEASFSKDRSTRRMSYVFWINFVGFVMTLWIGINLIKKYKSQSELENQSAEIKHREELAAKKKREESIKGSQFPLGVFHIELKTKENEKKIPGLMNLAEVEITLECDEKATCEYIKENQERIRNEITNSLLAVGKEELLTRDGKKNIKQSILERLNKNMTKGHLRNVHFTKLIVT